jgi:hypothetical protein
MESEGWLQVPIRPDFNNEKPLSDGLRRDLDVAPFRYVFGGARIHQHGNRCRAGHKLAEQLQPLARTAARQEADAGDVPAGPVEACHQPVLDRIGSDHKHDRHRGGRSLGRQRSLGVADNHGDRLADQLGDKGR